MRLISVSYIMQLIKNVKDSRKMQRHMHTKLSSASALYIHYL